MTPEFAAAFAKMQAELPVVPKDRKGQEGKQTYKYADLASIMAVAQPVMTAHGFALMHKPIVYQRDDGTTMAGVCASLIHTSGHVETAEFSMPVVKDYGTLAKAVGGVITYCRRYSMSILGICTEDDSESAPGVGSSPAGSAAIRKPMEQPKPRAAKKPLMDKEYRDQIKDAADRRAKDIGDDSLGPDEIIRLVAKSMGYKSPADMPNKCWETAFSLVQEFEPGEASA